MIEVGDYKAEITARTRWSSVLAARYEGWLLGKYPAAFTAILEQRAVARPSAENPAEKARFQKTMAGLETQYAEGLELANMILQFATLASRLKSLVTPVLNVTGGFTQDALFSAFEDYANAPLNGGFWFEAVTTINNMDYPPGDKASTGADPNSIPPGSSDLKTD